ncbi:MAG: VWA domain-containing protein [Desulfobacterales bacterium]|nr:VWA domain-containing protein [Desulfobacterales bacterium]
MMKISRIPIVLLLLALLFSNALADGMIIVHDPPWFPPPAPGPIVHRPHPFAPLTIKYHHVDVKITGQVAVTGVDQVFHNPNPRRLEGTFVFPIPEGASIDKFSMDIDGKQVEAELLDADKARKIFEDIVRKMRDPALLEYVGRGAFKARIFPIEPHGDKRVKLKYTQVLKSDNGLVEYIYPLNTERFSAQPIKRVAIGAEIKTTRPLKSVYSPSHEIEVIRKGDHGAAVGFETADARPDADFKLYYSFAPQKDREIALNLLAYNEADGEDGFFLLLASPGLQADRGEIVEKDVVFVLDASGSMMGDKLAQAKRALRYCIINLNRGDRFEVVRFSTEAEALFGGLVDATRSNQDKAVAMVDRFKPRGGTAIAEALLKAVEPSETRAGRARPYYVIFLTDGRPTIGVIDDDEILDALSRAVSGRTIRVFGFGIGVDINTHLLDNIAGKTSAVSQYVLPDEDIEVKVSNFFERIANPVLANVRLSASGGVRLSRMHPTALPDLFKGDQLILLGRYQGRGDAAIHLKGVFNGEPREIVEEVRFPAPGEATAHDFTPRLWATRRVGWLLDQMRLSGENKELRDEVTRLARRYGIVTPYTSYLIMEDEAHSPPGRPTPRLSRVEPEDAERVRGDLAGRYETFKNAKSGHAGVGSAKAAKALKRAEAPLFAMDKAKRAARLGEKYDATKEAIHQLTRFIRGRTFYWNNEEWVDALAADTPDDAFIHIEFGSDQYFELLKAHPDAHAWLAVGNRVKLKIGEKFYEVR